ncbi:MAG: phosphatidylglycerophosphatase A [Proteobacteria bacterium SG_bin4]|nr:MAG: phosphatidylglycerophosphatase A [Proteobacteria bacterium SG_bin4]
MTTFAPETQYMDGTQPAPFKPDLELVYSHPAYIIAFSGGVGLAPVAPGTFGTLVAFPLFWLCNLYLTPLVFLLVIDLMFIVGIWACGLSGKALGEPDHGGMVWDETVAFLLVLFFIPDEWTWQLAAFVLFRFFDIAKPQPIRYCDNRFKGGFGVMFDDLIAAFFTLLCLAGWKAWVLSGVIF